MPVIVAPSTQTVPDGTNVPTNNVASVALNTGDVLTFGFVSAASDPGATGPDFDLLLTHGVGGPVIINRNCFWSQTNVSVTYTATAPIGVTLALVGGGEPKGTHHGTVFGYHAETVLASLVLCQYGTEPQPTIAAAIFITPQLLQAWADRTNSPWLVPFLLIFAGTALVVTDLCSAGPPPLPSIDLQSVQAPITFWTQVLRAIAWPSLCQCKPGTPAPVPFPVPSPAQPAGWPTPPVFDCSNVDVCAALVQMQRQLSVMQQEILSNVELTTLIQRYQLPFAYVKGARHSNIAVSGSFLISRLAGVLIEVESRPPNLPTFTGEPPYIADLGWISILTADGLVDEVRLTRSDQIWLPPLMATATSLGLALREGVVISVTELQAET